MSFPKLMTELAASSFNFLFSLLHNRQRSNLSREEIRYLHISFSQFGEDLTVARLALERGLTNGFYVDAGAYHPIHCSNTLLLHKQGWRGVNLDLSPAKIDLFRQLRPDDLNVAAILSDTAKSVSILTQSNGLVDRIIEDPTHLTPQEQLQLQSGTTQTLTQLLSHHDISPRRIDYLNIDCEGHDLAVLKGLDLRLYPVEILTIEALDAEAEDSIRAYALSQGLQWREKICWTLVFTNS